ncbi:MAG TPA: hypothetical protein VNW47_15440 [Terriglobales bacterium]|jgi:hypothetical protein|nr:hypothetical protein [Terriglobales bacterium]
MTTSSQGLTGDELIERFEHGLTAADSFHHADHVRLAFEYLNRYPALDALKKFADALLRFATALGKPDRYHETITWAYLFLIRERMKRVTEAQTWEKFATENPDLLIWAKGSFGILERYYRTDTLVSPAARCTFLLPDKAGVGRGMESVR